MKVEGKFHKVSITLIDGVQTLKKMPGAMVWLKSGQRLQDLMNDERKFIPIYKRHQTIPDKVELKVLNKSVIALIEEEE